MHEPLIVLLFGIAIGFGLGYCVREWISRRRRMRYRNSFVW